MTTYNIQSRFVKLTDATVLASKYADGTFALIAIDGVEGDQEVLSVNLSAYGYVAPPGAIYVRDYGPHEGLPDALEGEGIATKAEPVKIGHGRGWMMTLNEGVLS